MGFLSKLFGSKPEGESVSSNAPAPSHEANWNVYFDQVENIGIGSILVDLGLETVAPIKERPMRLRVILDMKDPREDGLSSAKERGTLDAIDDALEASLNTHGAIYAGRINGGGKLLSIFYLPESAAVDESLAAVMATFPGYKYQHDLERDESWTSYLEGLYPSPIQIQSIQNRSVVDSLEKNGDNLEKLRQVDHSINFPSEKDRDSFIESIKGLGFTIETKEFDKDAELPYLLEIHRVDKVDHESVDEYVLDLWQKAQDANGDYDGWGTVVVKD